MPEALRVTRPAVSLGKTPPVIIIVISRIMDSDFINTQTDKMTNGIFLTYDFLGRQEILLVRRRESLFSWTRVLKGKRYCHLPFVYFLLSQERMYPSPACSVMKCPHSILSPNESLINGMDLNKRQNVGAVLSSTRRSIGSEIRLMTGSKISHNFHGTKSKDGGS